MWLNKKPIKYHKKLKKRAKKESGYYRPRNCLICRDVPNNLLSYSGTSTLQRGYRDAQFFRNIHTSPTSPQVRNNLKLIVCKAAVYDKRFPFVFKESHYHTITPSFPFNVLLKIQQSKMHLPQEKSHTVFAIDG